MDGKGVAVKLENNIGFGSHYYHNSFPLLEEEDKDNGSLGFTELLTLRDHSNAYLMEMFQIPCTSVQRKDQDLYDTLANSIQPPGTPNSSVSSASSDAVVDEPSAKLASVDEEELEKAPQELKVKKTNLKKLKLPRFAFMTKSEVDHLEDGYRWRKYGQKAVKNSPFPRSYYRCTTSSCNVKKRVERSFSDPSIVVTTYEGQHTHPSPVMARPTYGAAALNSGYSPLLARVAPTGQGLPLQRSLLNAGFGYYGANASERRFACESALFNDNGLLQDVVPPHMFKDER